MLYRFGIISLERQVTLLWKWQLSAVAVPCCRPLKRFKANDGRAVAASSHSPVDTGLPQQLPAVEPLGGSTPDRLPPSRPDAAVVSAAAVSNGMANGSNGLGAPKIQQAVILNSSLRIDVDGDTCQISSSSGSGERDGSAEAMSCGSPPQLPHPQQPATPLAAMEATLDRATRQKEEERNDEVWGDTPRCTAAKLAMDGSPAASKPLPLHSAAETQASDAQNGSPTQVNVSEFYDNSFEISIGPCCACWSFEVKVCPDLRTQFE